ncbi:BA75_03310T0 [Komagataella pastoris]|uniref:BA75_03310T0 n=1 Tax=Komagataella pastoris TaxID=4922 RepID=A0A1B2JCD9_PICPA|nr:BA75_03310T0 [Komagataella pastoris]
MSVHFLIAAIVFTILYGIFAIVSISILWKKRTIRTFYTGLFLFGLLRAAAQGCLIGFSAQEFIPTQWLIAYVVLKTEAYYLLILISLYLVCASHLEANGGSWSKRGSFNSSKSLLDCKRINSNTIGLLYCLTVVANVLVAVGGTLLASLNANEYDNKLSRIDTSKGLRATGQALFLISTLAVLALAACVVILDNIRSYLLASVFLATPFLLVRGLYGLISPFVQGVNYASMANYTSTGMSTSFIVTEYVLSTTMEFISGCIFLSTYYVVHFHKRQTNNTITADEDYYDKPLT